MQPKNIYENPRANKADGPLIASAFIMGIIFMIGYLQASSLQNFGTIYFDLTLISFILVILAVASRFKLTAWVFYGKINTLPRLLLAIAIPAAVAYFISTNAFAGLSIGIPLFSITQAASASSLILYSVIAFYGPFMEEFFWIGLLLPSMMLYGKTTSQMISVAANSLAILLILLGVEVIGEIGIAIGLAFFAMEGLVTLQKVYKPLNRLGISMFPFALAIAAFIMVILHAYSYGSFTADTGLYLGAGIFFLLEGVMDYIFQSFVPSLIMHTVNNAIVGAAALSIGTLFGMPAWIIMVAVMALFIISVFRYATLATKPYTPSEKFERRFLGNINAA